MSRHIWPEWVVVALLVIAVLVGLPAACFAETVSKTETVASSWSLLGRYSHAPSLGFDKGQIGVELSLNQGQLVFDLVATTAAKVDGGEGYGLRLVIEREIVPGLSIGLRAAHLDLERYSKTGAGLVVTYRIPLDEALSLRLRAYGPSAAAPREWGAAARLDALIGRFLASIEFEGWIFGRDTGRRVALLAGRSWR